ETSFLHWLFYVRSAGGILPLITTGGGAQDSRFVGGSQRVPLRVADALGGRVQLERPVRRITQDALGVVVETDRRRNLKAGRVVVAMPPTLAGRIVYSPILPALRDQLMQRMPMGFYGKVEVVYPTPFWRAAGLSGQVVSDTGPLRVTFDNSPPDGPPGVLLAFFAGDDGRAWAQLPAAERRAAGVVRAILRRRRAQPHVVSGEGLDGRVILARRPRRADAGRRPDALRAGAARP